METKELMKHLAVHPIVKSEMALESQLGLPYLEKRNGKLCICFKVHKELLSKGMVEFYAPQYEIAWVYPFQHVIYFNNLIYDKQINTLVPVGYMPLQEMTGAGKYVIEELYDECDRVLKFQKIDGQVSDVMVKSYQKKFSKAVYQLGLERLYSEAW